MTRFTALISAAVASVATQASADVTPEQVWDNLSDSLSRVGWSVVVADRAVQSDRLVLSGVNTIFQIGPSRSVSEMPEIQLIDRGDGSVAIVVAPEIRVTSQTMVDDELLAENTGVVRWSGMEIIASGDPDRIIYDIDADEMLTETKVAATELTPVAQTSNMTLTGFTSQMISEPDGDDLGIDMSGSASTYMLKMVTQVPEGAMGMQVDLTGNDISFESTGTLPPAGNGNGFQDLVNNPKGLTATYGLGAATMSMSSKGNSGNFAMEIANDSSTFSLDLKNGVIGYDVASTGNAFSVVTGGLPPLAGTAQRADVGLSMPLVQTDDPRDMSMRVRVEQLTLEEQVWALFDPGQTLPRDAAHLELDMTGRGMWTVDLLDPQAMADADANGTMPIDLQSATLRSLTLDALGARIDAQGEVEFQNTDQSPVPVPVGGAIVSAQGVQGLIEKLQVAGLLPVQFGMMATVMLGTYAVPGDAADSFTSQIEFTENGGITANGQPLR